MKTPQAAPAGPPPAPARRRARQTRQTRRAPRRTVRLLVILVGVVFVGNLIVGERGLVSMLRAAGELEELSRATAALRARNDRLREEARRLREDPRRVEELARGELGLMRSGEKLFIVVDRAADRPPSPAAAAGDATAPDPPQLQAP